MMYTLDASGQTLGNSTITPLWPAGSAGTGLFIQNRSGTLIEVVIALPAVGGGTPPPIVIQLEGRSTHRGARDTNHTVVDPTLAVGVRSQAAGAAYTAVRLA